MTYNRTLSPWVGHFFEHPDLGPIRGVNESGSSSRFVENLCFKHWEVVATGEKGGDIVGPLPELDAENFRDYLDTQLAHHGVRCESWVSALHLSKLLVAMDDLGFVLC